MHSETFSDLPNFWQRSCKLILPACWIVGLGLGVCVAVGAGDSFSLMMRGIDFYAVSIPGLLLVTVFPFLLTALAVFLSKPYLLLLLVLVKSFSLGFCTAGIMIVYGSASWLVQFLLMFTDSFTLPLLMWLWLHSGNPSGLRFYRDFTVCTLVALAFGIFDICVVSPFTAMLL